MIPRNILFILSRLVQPTHTLEIRTFSNKDPALQHDDSEALNHKDSAWIESQYSNERLWLEVLKLI